MTNHRSNDGPDPLASFRMAAHTCAGVMLESAGFIQSELESVDAAQAHRQAIKSVCKSFVGNWFDIGTELGEMAELGLPDYSPQIRRRVDRIHNWLGEALPTVHDVMEGLSAAAKEDPRCSPAYILVAESATNVLRAFVDVSEAREHYLEAHEREGGA